MLEPTTIEGEAIDRDCPCVRCGYNLRTRAPADRCPECRAPVVDSLRGHAVRLAGADRRWLRAVTNGVLWMLVAMPIAPVCWWAGLADPGQDGWLDGRGRSLALVLTPAVLAVAACWRMGARERGRPSPTQTDQPATRRALRVGGALCVVPVIAGFALLGRDEDHDGTVTLLQWLGWAAIPATVLFFRRLKYVARRVPANFLVVQCDVIGSQLPATMLVCAVAVIHEFRGANALVFATPAPVIGLPWVLVHVAPLVLDNLWDLSRFGPVMLLAVWAVAVMLGLFVLLVEFLVVLIRVRRSDPALVAYCRERVARIDVDEADGT